MRRLARASLLAIALGTVPCAGIAADRAFYNELPLTYMTPEDRKIAVERINRALDDGNDGETYRWQNAATGASGSVTPKASFTRNGARCRNADFSTTAGGRKNASTWKLCKTPEGWKIVD